MGVLRILLALSVVFNHVDVFGIIFIPGPLAVQCFFIVSGFYMSLVLGSKYSLDRKGTLTFYLSRYLRLAPTYWCVLLLTLWISYIRGTTIHLPLPVYAEQLETVSDLTKFWMVFPNIFMLGQDTFQFLHLDQPGGQFIWTTSAAPMYPAENFLLNPPAWSLGVELWFYMLVPFLAARSVRVLFAVAGLSFGLRMYLVSIGLDHDPFTFRFFPNELLLFVSGMLLNRLYQSIHLRLKKSWGWAALAGIVGLILLYPQSPFESVVNWVGFILIFAALLPLIFHSFKQSRADRIVGELSYPLYICHIFIQQVAYKFYPGPIKWGGLVIVVGSVLCSVALYLVIERPMDRIRAGLLRRRAVGHR